MNGVDRFLRVLNGQPADRAPVVGVTSVVTVDLMRQVGSRWPDAHHDPEQMVRAGAAAHIQIATRDMDALLYDNEPFIEALTTLARRHAKSHIDILVWDSMSAIKQGHRLINLAQRLSSYVQIRKPADEHAHYTEAFLVADGIGYMTRNLTERYEGIASFNAPLQARNLSQLFSSMWDKSTPDPQLRRLHI